MFMCFYRFLWIIVIVKQPPGKITQIFHTTNSIFYRKIAFFLWEIQVFYPGGCSTKKGLVNWIDHPWLPRVLLKILVSFVFLVLFFECWQELPLFFCVIFVFFEVSVQSVNVHFQKKEKQQTKVFTFPVFTLLLLCYFFVAFQASVQN